MAALTALLISPVLVPMLGLVRQGDPLGSLWRTAIDPTVLTWFRNSTALAGGATVASLVIGAPAAYVLARLRGRLVDGAALLLFVLQALPVLVLVVPLFIVFAHLSLVSLPGVGVLYVGFTLASAIWMLQSAFHEIPVALEEAAWLDGCSVFGGFVRICLRVAQPAIVGAAIMVFLFAWNEYLVAVVFLHDDADFTLGIALAGQGSPPLQVLMLIPPLLVFAVLHRSFRFGGMGGALAGT